MPAMPLIRAATNTLDQARGRDEIVVVLGEDVGKNGFKEHGVPGAH